MLLRLFFGLICLSLATSFALAQSPDANVTTRSNDVRLSVSGTLQTRASVGWLANTNTDRSRLGFGVRRARLRVRAGVGPKAGAYVQLGGASGEAFVLDALAFYDLSERVQVRLGRLVSAQPRAFQLTSHTRIDAVARAAIARRWARATIGSDGRDFGMDLRYRTEQAEAFIFLHNGDGSWNRLRGNVRDDVLGDPTRGLDRTLGDLAASAAINVTPAALSGVEVGGFVGYNGSQNPNTEIDGIGRNYVSYAAHLYWGADPGSQPVRLKADVIGITYEEIGSNQQSVLGVALTGALQLHRAAELFGRAERYDPELDTDDDGDFFFDAGISLSLSALRGKPFYAERLTLGYSGRLQVVF